MTTSRSRLICLSSLRNYWSLSHYSTLQGLDAKRAELEALNLQLFTSQKGRPYPGRRFASNGSRELSCVALRFGLRVEHSRNVVETDRWTKQEALHLGASE